MDGEVNGGKSRKVLACFQTADLGGKIKRRGDVVDVSALQRNVISESWRCGRKAKSKGLITHGSWV